MKQVVNGWGMNGVTTLQSGQPYSVNDFSGGAASIYLGRRKQRHHQPNRARRRRWLDNQKSLSSRHDRHQRA